ncbi:hypothetical protein COO58_17585 [Micromonospora sp. WMMA1996]|uniref:hypothetical protein n=1 Tax=Micromonospora sp. WMMA1996 TaxID=2039878 RepID=UPI000BFA7BA2|nr:hypothetical protein [Micromonospora sp. WMMA1996]PGH46020.1 hypothetical protein COO58_17585 [Micromonospora sp. WMMA1996]
MARGKKLSDAYIELRADDSKLDGDVKVKATRAARGFGAQLNNALKALSIDPIDVKASPKAALAAIETTRDRLREMSRDAESVEMRVRTERATSQLEKFRRQLGTVDDEPVEVKAEVSPAQRQIEQLRRQLVSLGIDPVDIDADPSTALAQIARVDQQLRQLSGEAATVRVKVDVDSARASLARLTSQFGDAAVESADGFATRFGQRLGGQLLAKLPANPEIAAAVASVAALAAPTLAATVSAAVVGAAGAGGIVGGVAIASKHPAVRAAAELLGDDFTETMQRAGVSFVPAVVDALGDVRSEIPGIGADLERAFSRVSVYVDPLTQDFLSGARSGVEGFATAVERSGPVLLTIGNIAERTGVLVGDIFTGLSEHAPEAANALAMVWTVFEYGTRSVFGTIEMLTQAYGWLAKFGLVLTGNLDQMAQLTAQQEAAKGSSSGLSTELQNLLSGFTNTSTSAAGLTSQVRTLKELLAESTNRTLDARAANREYQAAIDAAAASVKQNGATLDTHTAKGRANQAALDDLVRTTQRKAEATRVLTGDEAKAAAVTEAGRAAFIRAATAMGMGSAEAKRLAGQLFAIPNVDRTVKIRTEQAMDAIRRVQQAQGRIKDIVVGVYYKTNGDLKLPGGTSLRGYAAGGPVEDAPGPKGVDSRAYMLARGEHVFTAAEVDRMGGQAAVSAFRQQIMSWPTGWRPGTTSAASAAVAPASRPLVMDSGGAIMPGWNPPIYNGTGRAEPVMPAQVLDELIDELRGLRDAVEGGLIAAVRQVAPRVGDELRGTARGALALARGR